MCSSISAYKCLHVQHIFTVSNGYVGDITGAEDRYTAKLYPTGTDQASMFIDVSAVTVYTAITNLPTSGNSVGDLGFVYKDKDGNFGWDSLYIWVGNGENDYGGWYKVPIFAFNYNKDD